MACGLFEPAIEPYEAETSVVIPISVLWLMPTRMAYVL